MKRQMKKWLGIFAAAFICFSPVSALAAETDTPLTITSGLDLECEEAECTFSEARYMDYFQSFRAGSKRRAGGNFF